LPENVIQRLRDCGLGPEFQFEFHPRQATVPKKRH
jgi:hypothetical protein